MDDATGLAALLGLDGFRVLSVERPLRGDRDRRDDG